MVFYRNQVHSYLDVMWKYDWVLSNSFYLTKFFEKIKKYGHNRAFYRILAPFCMKKHNYAYKKCADWAENEFIC